VPCDTALSITSTRHGDRAYRREIVHRDEHSSRFQVIYLQRRLGARPWTLVPISAAASTACRRAEDAARRAGDRGRS
jgi:predicted class III extradiol MEMO1 family dioxygenase